MVCLVSEWERFDVGVATWDDRCCRLSSAMGGATNGRGFMMRGIRCFAAVFIVCLLSVAWAAEPASKVVRPLARAHAHNDYYHERPLLDALDHGFCNVEVDIFLVDGELRVGHGRSELRKGRTLEKLYLKPLAERVRKNGGRVFKDGPRFTLLVDIKADGAKVYAELDKLLERYADVVSGTRGGKFHPAAIDVVISGDRPKKEIAADKTRFCGIDGRLSDLDSKQPADLLPMISDRWTSHFKWRGKGPIPAAEKAKLRRIVEKAHARGRKVRFWATPESPAVWKELSEAGVDLINTDRLAELQKFLSQGSK